MPTILKRAFAGWVPGNLLLYPRIPVTVFRRDRPYPFRKISRYGFPEGLPLTAQKNYPPRFSGRINLNGLNNLPHLDTDLTDWKSPGAEILRRTATR
ncbi:MAG: hypothetical protein KGL35_05230 [Bradyrhizobium sp.]|nr:hypothetical protein [Bradyrhizobium sp.]